MLLVLVSGSVSDMSVHRAAVFVYPCFATTPLRRGQQAQVDAHRRVLCLCVLVFLAVYAT